MIGESGEAEAATEEEAEEADARYLGLPLITHL
jgi:hypothetical protein